MNDEPRDDAPLSPSASAGSEGMPLRWIIGAFAVGLLLLGGYKGVQWLEANRDTLLRAPVAAPPGPAASVAERAAPLPAPPASIGRTIRPPQPNAPSADQRGEPTAPAVAGDGSIRKCVVNGQTTYTNQPCPEGTEATTQPDSAVDANGVVGSTGEALTAPVVRERPFSPDGDPSARESECGYLASEIERLRYEFDQPLPPPVLDQIAGRLKSLRDNSAQLKCPPEPAQAGRKPAGDKGGGRATPAPAARPAARPAT